MTTEAAMRPRGAALRQERAAAARMPREAFAKPVINPLESPLAWLRRRKDKDGQPMIGAAEFEAGERLRADYTFGQLMPSVTSRWSPAGAGDSQSRGFPGAGSDLQDHALAARQRVNRAVDAVGPELASILIDVCCHLRGLEDTERTKGWPLRSAKVVLQLALARLARHYGMLPATASRAADGPAQVRHWGAADYKPRHSPSEE